MRPAPTVTRTILGFALTALAACSSGPPTEPAPTATTAVASVETGGGQVGDVCALLDDGAVEAALGSPVTARESAFDGQCQWTLDDGGSAFPTLFVEVTSPGGRDRYDILADQMPSIEVAGAEAYQQGDSVWAVKGDTAVKVSWFSGTVEQMLPLVEAIVAGL